MDTNGTTIFSDIFDWIFDAGNLTNMPTTTQNKKKDGLNIKAIFLHFRINISYVTWNITHCPIRIKCFST